MSRSNLGRTAPPAPDPRRGTNRSCMVEILHVDTVASRFLYRNLNSAEKADAQAWLKDFFRSICSRTCRSVDRRPRLCGFTWAGDGGFALFKSEHAREFGLSAHAGEQFLEQLPAINGQTAEKLNMGSFGRHVRIKAHRGEIFLTSDKDIDSAAPECLDEFLKHEQNFAPETDALFITDPVYRVLPYVRKARFELFEKEVVAGSLRTALYRRKRRPIAHSEDILKHGDEVRRITQVEWNYLRTQIRAHAIIIAARNQITKGLIQHLDTQSLRGKSSISSELLQELTLNSLVAYLRLAFKSRQICVSYWRAVERHGKSWLQMVSYRYPENKLTDPQRRCFLADDRRYKICEAFQRKEPIATASVRAENNLGTWQYFDKKQSNCRRRLMSALQIPVYCERRDRSKDVKGVLSFDADQSDVFLPSEIPLWREELVGFLANLALAEKLRESRA